METGHGSVISMYIFEGPKKKNNAEQRKEEDGSQISLKLKISLNCRKQKESRKKSFAGRVGLTPDDDTHTKS